MKTRNFTLIAAILMMGTVVTATGQPDRGERRGNRENSSSSDLKSSRRSESTVVQNRRSGDEQNARTTYENRNHTVDKPEMRKESSSNDKRMEVIEKNQRRSYSVSGADRGQEQKTTEKKGDLSNHGNRPAEKKYYDNNSRSNRYNGTDQGRYSDNRSYRDIPSRDHQNVWSNRNYSRQEWEHRHYNWNERNWNFSSYYKKGYVPYYFRDNRHYWYYPGYGHILRGFRYEPVVVYSGSIPYYYEDGFFYRYYPGVGYVWIEEPSGIWFNELPHMAVKVKIGGKIYFRMGNAYFRFGSHGFRLVLLPDRYYDPRFDRGVSFQVSARF
jgi:hypothetical protein